MTPPTRILAAIFAAATLPAAAATLPVNPATFAAVLAKAQGGDTLLLAPGDYTGLSLNAISFTPAVNITSADRTHPAVLTNFNEGIFKPVSGLHWSYLDFKVTLPATGAFNLYNASDVTYDHIHIYGPAGAPDPMVAALNVFDSTRISFTNGEIERVAHGFSVARSDNIIVTGNHIHHVNADTLDFVQVGNALIANNVLHDFYTTDGNHSDAMQFATVNSTKSSHDITIRDNLIYRGAGGNAQGIFLRDELGTFPFQNVTISNNTVIGTGASALRPIHASGVTITGNELVTLAGGDPTTLLVQTSDQVSASGNTAVQVSIAAKDGNTNLTLGSNPLTQPVTDGGADAVKRFAAAHPAMAPLLASLFPALAAPAPAPAPTPAPAPQEITLAPGQTLIVHGPPAAP